jgi:hypothetical protein
MFESQNQFFPTPRAIADKMIAPYIQNHRLSDRPFISKDLYPIADFSAGKGDLLDPIADIVELNNIFAVEIDPNLRAILNDKGYKVIGSDFLSFDEPREFGLVVLNPPFRNAEQHILHAWRFVRDGGELVSLIGSHTIANESSKYREQLNKLIKAHGTTEDLGECFEDAERKTSVKVSMIRLSKPKQETTVDFDPSGFKKDFVSDEAFSANPLAHANYLKALVMQYKMVERSLIDRHELNKQLKFYLNGVGGDRYGSDNVDKICSVPLADQLTEVKDRFWSEVFTKAKIASKVTGNFKKNFEKFRKEQGQMSFSEENVQEMLMMFFGNYDSIMTEALTAMFDKLTSYYCEENKIHWEGWKTNKGYKLNAKVIYPYGVRVYSDRWGSTFSSSSDELTSDLDKILCWLSGKKYEDLTIKTSWAIREKCDSANKLKDHQGKFESDFFEMRIFKKGTLHLVFKDRQLLDRFNIKAAEDKNWIGGKGF